MTDDLRFLSNETLSALDKFITKTDVPPSPRLTREEAIDVIVRDWLMGQGYLQIPKTPGDVPRVVSPVVPALHVTDDTQTVFGQPSEPVVWVSKPS